MDRIIGLEGVRSDIAMMRTPDGHGRLELVAADGLRETDRLRSATATGGMRSVATCTSSTAICRPAACPHSRASWWTTRSTFMTKALVIGGGVAGLAVAIALRHADLDAAVYEAYPTGADERARS